MAGISAARGLLDREELMRLILARYTLKECAALLNVTYNTACRRARQPDFLTELRELNNDLYKEVDHELRVMTGLISNRVVEMSDKALDLLERVLDDDSADDRLRVRVAQDFLDRNQEAAKTTKHTAEVKHSYADPRLLAIAAQAAREMDEHAVGLETDLG